MSSRNPCLLSASAVVLLAREERANALGAIWAELREGTYYSCATKFSSDILISGRGWTSAVISGAWGHAGARVGHGQWHRTDTLSPRRALPVRCRNRFLRLSLVSVRLRQ